jgi:transcriptional regulator with XRE-family HTH domain
MDTLIPAFLHRQRNQRSLTLERLSAKGGMSPQHLSEIESGKRDPRLSSIERMADGSWTVTAVPSYRSPGAAHRGGRWTRSREWSRDWVLCLRLEPPGMRRIIV